MNDSRQPVSLLPLFRSRAQYRLIGELFTNPDRLFTIGELAKLTGASHPTISREAARLKHAGLVRSRGDGARTLVHANTDAAVFADLRNLMAKVYGPPAVIAEEFGDLDAALTIFGSWAARFAGEPGPPANDIDVLVVGDVEPREVWEAAARATRRVGLEVNPVIRTVDEWAGDTSAFAAELRRRPALQLDAPRRQRSGRQAITDAEATTRWG
jgi:DNA-binding transcriptional ArsR family regulator